MIDFACKKISKEDILRCSFNLNKTEYTVFSILLKELGNIKQISEKTQLDRTTIQKSLSILLERNVIIRKRENLSYLYEVRDKPQFKKKLNKIVNQWYNSVKKEIKQI